MNDQPVEVEARLMSGLLTLVRQWGSTTANWGIADSVGVPVPDSAIRIIFTVAARAEEFRPGEMAEFLGISRANLSRTLASLRAEGLITGEAAPDDRRAVHLTLTPTGKEAYAKLYEFGVDYVRRAGDGFTQEELELVNRFVTSLVTAVGGPALLILPPRAN